MGISRVADELLASQEGLSLIELDSYKVNIETM
jgi:hypothetical protein